MYSYDPTILACALLANDVYGVKNGAPGWQREAQLNASDDGFFGAAYSNGDNMIVAIRGTQEGRDVMDDANMVPVISADMAEVAMRNWVMEYCRGTPAMSAGRNLEFLAKLVFSKIGKVAKKWGNRIPPYQARLGYTFAKQAYRVCKLKNLKLRCFTGHSLGGALAQYLSEQTGDGGLTEIPKKIPAVAFNAPNMGTIDGMRKGSGGGILCVNSRLDPLSLSTKLAGNESHAVNEKYYIPVETWAMDPPPKLPDPPTPKEQGEFNSWFLKAAGRYHSMDNLYLALMSKYPGNMHLRDFFPNS